MENVMYAGFWKRAGAVILDGLLIGGATSLLGFGGMQFGQMPMMYANPYMYYHMYGYWHWYGAAATGIGPAKLAIGWLYYSLMESSKYQATVGKMALGIKVTDMQGARVSFGRATSRFFGKIVSAVILGIGFLMAAFTSKKQALHDMMAHTLVVNK